MFPQILRATISLPSSKSICNRALIIAALSGKQTQLQNLSDCDDTRVLVRALQSEEEVIDIMAAGTAMRFLTSLLATMPAEHVITGTERMRNRPIGQLVDALRAIGAQIEYLGEEGFLPLRIKGCALDKHRIVKVENPLSTQFVSALLLIGANAVSYTHLTLPTILLV